MTLSQDDLAGTAQKGKTISFFLLPGLKEQLMDNIRKMHFIYAYIKCQTLTDGQCLLSLLCARDKKH